METKDIIEGNKLIAEFMGYGRNWQNGLGEFSGRYYNVPQGLFICKDEDWNDWTKETYAIKPEALIFHSDWSWLMPVVEKVNKLTNPKKSGDTTLQSMKNDLRAYVGYVDITKVFNQVIKIINWYNENKPKPE